MAICFHEYVTECRRPLYQMPRGYSEDNFAWVSVLTSAVQTIRLRPEFANGLPD